jgi:hypothetical protein
MAFFRIGVPAFELSSGEQSDGDKAQRKIYKYDRPICNSLFLKLTHAVVSLNLLYV